MLQKNMYIVVNSVGQISSQEVGLTKQDQKKPSTELGKEVVLALTRALKRYIGPRLKEVEAKTKCQGDFDRNRKK